jgi:CubicO group peptidase (beta-lactamase class C family)
MMMLGTAAAAEDDASRPASPGWTPDHVLVSPVRLLGAGAAAPTLAGEMARLHVPAVGIAVVRNHAMLWARDFGTLSDNGPAATAETRFQAASLSKTITAVAVLRLVQAGRLDLDRDVNDYLKSWKLPQHAGGAVTLRKLLSHTGGVGVEGFGGYAAGEPLPSVVQILDGLPPANTPAIRVEAMPGQTWRYSGGGYTIVQQLLTDLAGQDFPSLMQELVLRPLGMRHSGFDQPLGAGDRGKIALPHQEDGTEVAGGPHVYPELAAAGLWSTPADLARFVSEMQLCLAGKGTFLSKALAQEAMTPGLGGWGLGFQVEGAGAGRRFGHLGANAGYRDRMVGYVAGGNGVIVMTNGDAGKTLADEVVRAAALQYGWAGFEPDVRKVTPQARAHLEDLAGVYDLGDGRALTVSRVGGRLQGTVSGRRPEPLFGVGEGRFVSTSGDVEVRWDDYNRPGTVSLEGMPLSFQRRRP